MADYPIKQFPSNQKIVLNLSLTLFGIGEVNTKDGFLEVYLL